MEGIK
jgi:vacuolar protein sorting-associated protein 13A/C